MADDGTTVDSPPTHSDGLVRFAISVDGEVQDASQILTLRVRRAINHIPWAEIVLVDGSVSTGTFDLSDKPTFAPGAEVTISAGYDENAAALFRGIVVRHSVKIDGSGGSRLVIECRDKAYSMTIGRNNARYGHQTDSDIISTLIRHHGLSADVAATRTQHDERVQAHSSDWDFMLARAKANGLLVNVDAGVVSVKTPNTSGSAAVTCTWGDNLISFEAGIDAAQQKGGVETLCGRVEFQGSARAVPDSLIDMKNVGTRFSGAFFVSAVEHELADGRWITRAEFGLPPEQHAEREDFAAGNNGALLPGAIGLPMEDGVVTVITPSNNRVVLDDRNQSITVQDQHDNSIVLSSAGIALNSQSDIRLSAQGTVTIAANAAININAQSDARLTGLNVMCEAQVGFTGNASATAELSAAGQTTVKGGIVMIN